MTTNNNITRSDKYKAIEYRLYQCNNNCDDVMIKCNKYNSDETKYIHKTEYKTPKSQYRVIDFSDKSYSEIPFVTIEITCISDEDTEIQKEILSIRENIGKEELRGFYIQYKGKLIGGLGVLPTPKFITARNFRNVRIKMNIGDNEPFGIMDDITMTNKTHLMFDNAQPLYLWILTYIIKEDVLKYLDYTHKTQQEKTQQTDAGLIDLPKYIYDSTYQAKSESQPDQESEQPQTQQHIAVVQSLEQPKSPAQSNNKVKAPTHPTAIVQSKLLVQPQDSIINKLQSHSIDTNGSNEIYAKKETNKIVISSSNSEEINIPLKLINTDYLVKLFNTFIEHGLLTRDNLKAIFDQN